MRAAADSGFGGTGPPAILRHDASVCSFRAIVASFGRCIHTSFGHAAISVMTGGRRESISRLISAVYDISGWNASYNFRGPLTGETMQLTSRSTKALACGHAPGFTPRADLLRLSPFQRRDRPCVCARLPCSPRSSC
jgi:hypothetical protein